MSPRGLPQAAPRGFPRNGCATHVAADRGNAAHGLGRAGNRLSARRCACTTAPRRDDVLDRIIREAEGAFPQAARRPNIVPAFLGSADDEARPQRHPWGAQVEAWAEGRKSSASLVARLACRLYWTGRSIVTTSARVGAAMVRIIPRRDVVSCSKGLDDSASSCRGSSQRAPATACGAQPRNNHSLNACF